MSSIWVTLTDSLGTKQFFYDQFSVLNFLDTLILWAIYTTNGPLFKQRQPPNIGLRPVSLMTVILRFYCMTREKGWRCARFLRLKRSVQTVLIFFITYISHTLQNEVFRIRSYHWFIRSISIFYQHRWNVIYCNLAEQQWKQIKQQN